VLQEASFAVENLDMHIVMCDLRSPVYREGLLDRAWRSAKRRAIRAEAKWASEWFLNGSMQRCQARAHCWHGVTLFWGIY
jgi:hypothetical protein